MRFHKIHSETKYRSLVFNVICLQAFRGNGIHLTEHAAGNLYSVLIIIINPQNLLEHAKGQIYDIEIKQDKVCCPLETPGYVYYVCDRRIRLK